MLFVRPSLLFFVYYLPVRLYLKRKTKHKFVSKHLPIIGSQLPFRLMQQTSSGRLRAVFKFRSSCVYPIHSRCESPRHRIHRRLPSRSHFSVVLSLNHIINKKKQITYYCSATISSIFHFRSHLSAVFLEKLPKFSQFPLVSALHNVYFLRLTFLREGGCISECCECSESEFSLSVNRVGLRFSFINVSVELGKSPGVLKRS